MVRSILASPPAGVDFVERFRSGEVKGTARISELFGASRTSVSNLKGSGVASDRTIRTFEHQNSDRNSVTIQEILSEFIRNSEI